MIQNMINRVWGVALLLLVSLLGGCDKQGEQLTADYGYVQFHLVKASQLDTASTRATDVLDWLSDACKITVVMQHDGSTITQTLNVTSHDKESAEWGLFSEKLRLLAGDYNIIGYYIYNNLDQEILVGDGQGSFTIEHNGLVVKSIGVETIERGIACSRRSEGCTPCSAQGIREYTLHLRERLPVQFNRIGGCDRTEHL